MKLIMADGCFDGLHAGHIAHLQQARAMGDRLVVLLASDAKATVFKGPNRPVFHFAQRREVLLALRCVDEVLPQDDSPGAVAQQHPAIFVKGAEYAGVEDPVLDAVRVELGRYGGAVAFTDAMLSSSSHLLNGAGLAAPTSASSFLQHFRSQHDFGEVWGYVERMRGLRAAVYGEPIIDRYTHVTMGGKSAKENVISWVKGESVDYSGGILIIAAHLQVLTRSYPVGVDHSFKPILKEHFVADGQKMAQLVHNPEVASLRGDPSPGHDFAVVADFGHGMFPTSECTARIAQLLPWWALTVQSNSLNWGFNLATKWPRPSYLVLNEAELALADQGLPEPLDRAVCAITKGACGCTVMNPEYGPVDVPALTERVVDRSGAGDCFLAMTAPLVYLEAPPDIVGFLGNAAGALHVSTPGNQPLDLVRLRAFVEGLMR